MFKTILRQFIDEMGISQEVISIQIGDSQQAVSDFLKKEGKPQDKTKKKYFEKLEGFKEYYDTTKLQAKSSSKDGKLSHEQQQIINDAFLMHKDEVSKIPAVIDFMNAVALKAENNLMRELEGLKRKP